MYKLELSLNKNVVEALRSKGTVDFDICVSLKLIGTRAVYIQTTEPFYIYINKKLVSADKVQEVRMGEIHNDNIIVSDEYKSGNRKNIIVTDELIKNTKEYCNKHKGIPFMDFI